MTVKDILAAKGRAVITTTPDTPLLEAMALLIDHAISCLPVENEQNELIGIVSDKDIFRCAFKQPDNFTRHQVKDVMTTELIVGLETDEVGYVAGIMTNNRIRHVPIVDGKRIVGLISAGDIVKTRMQDFEVENRYLREYIQRKYPG